MGAMADEGLLIVKWSHIGIVVERPIADAKKGEPNVQRIAIPWPITERSLEAAIMLMDDELAMKKE